MTKLVRPTTHAALLARPRLVDRLRRVTQSKLTLICAPAGFGKTTLLSQWIPTAGCRVAWVSLDTTDNDPVRFLTYLIASLQAHKVQINRATLSSLRLAGGLQFHPLLTALINAVANESSFDDLVLVLDDYHLIESQVIHDGMSFLINHLPPRLYLVIASRTDPPLPVARLRGLGELNELRAADLRFGLEESALLLNDTLKLGLSHEELAALDKRVEGWAAGLQIAAVLIRQTDNVPEFIWAFAGSHRYIVDYFVEESLHHQSQAMQRFMLQTSILDRLNAELCEVVTGQPQSRTLLDQLARANSFIVPMDHEGLWYRYHHLFAEALRASLHKSCPNDVASLYVLASRWCSARGLIHDALRYALAAGDVRVVTDLVEQTGTAAASWGDLIPAAPSDHGSGASRHTCTVGKPGGVVDFSHWWANDLMQASEMLTEANLMSQAAGDVSNAVSALTQLAGLQVVRGQLRLAAETYGRALDLAPKCRGPGSNQQGGLHTATGRLCYEWNNLDDAARHAVEGLDLARKDDVPVVVVGGYGVVALVEHARGNSDRALDFLRQAEDLARENGLLRASSMVTSRKVRFWLARGEVDAAVAWAQSSGLSVDDEPVYVRETEYVSLALVRIALGESEVALPLLDRMLRAAELAGRAGTAIKLLVARALALATLCRMDEAVAVLEQALVRAEPQGYVRTFVDMGPRMQEMLLEIQGVKSGNSGDTVGGVSKDYVGRLLAAFDPATTFAEPVPPFAAPSSNGKSWMRGRRLAGRRSLLLLEAISERELEVLRLVDAGASNRDIAAQLVVALSTVKKHINSIYGKLGVCSRTQAVAKARRLELLSPND